MKKFRFLVGFGLKKRIYKKAFIITNIIIGIIIIAIVNIPNIIAVFSDDSDEVQVLQTAIVNNSDDTVYPLETNIIQTLNQSTEKYEFEEADNTLSDNQDFWDQENLDILIIFSGDLKQPNVEVFALDEDYRLSLTQSIQLVLYEYQDIGYANYNIVSPPASGEDPGLSEEDQMFIDGIGSLLFLPVFFLIIMATQFLGVDIIEEKSSKAIETIIASVPPKTHFLSKITASISFLLIQSAVLIGFGLIALLVSKAFASSGNFDGVSLFTEFAKRIPNWPILLLLTILFLLFGSLLFLVFAAFLASTSTSQEDYQQAQLPLMFLLLGGYYITIFLPILNADGLIRVFAYIPFFSTMVAPMAYIGGNITIIEAIISLVINVCFVFLLIYFISPIYRVAILSYEETKFFKRIKFYIKKAFSK
ncbi:MAG: ABC transporter permease [Candidatus Izimaplasma sp.]|nr:ABC transporter permease [Candidatus Izimaplasma bacterium]